VAASSETECWAGSLGEGGGLGRGRHRSGRWGLSTPEEVAGGVVIAGVVTGAGLAWVAWVA
jgi:hypothetical protein